VTDPEFQTILAHKSQGLQNLLIPNLGMGKRF